MPNKTNTWKELLDELRDGTKIYIVDGEHVRDNLDEQFTEGGHSEVYSFIPKSEIWVEHLESPSDMKENLTHELFEYYEMKEEENSYEKAHELASDIENALRRIPDYPGEQEPTKHPSNIYPHEKKESSMKIKKSAGLRKPKYVLYFDPKDHVEMNGRGIKYIYDAESDEKLSFEQGIEAIIEDLSGDIPEFYDYELNLYVGNATYFTYDLMVDYHPDEVPDEIVDKVGEWLDTNTFFEEIGKDGEETLDSKDELEGVKDLMHGIKKIKESTMKINSNTFQLKKGSEEHKELESILSKIAKDNSISDVEEIRVDVSQDTGIVHFKFAGEFNPLKEYALGKGHEKAEKDLREEEERMLKEDFPEDYEEFESFEEESDLGERLQEDYPEEFRGEPDISERTDRRRMSPKTTFPKRKRR